MSKINPKISVLITAYNVENYIEDSLLSVFAQSYTDYELVIVNDGSTDDTMDIISNIIKSENFKHKPKIYSFENNKGIPIRANEALSHASGEYVAIQDGDDLSIPYRFEKQVKVLDNHQDIFAIGGQCLKIDEFGNDIGSLNPYPLTHKDIVYQIKHKKRNSMANPTSMFRLDKFKEINGYSEDSRVKLVQDFELWTRAIKHGYILSNLNLPLIKYRVRSESNTVKHKTDMIKSHMIVWQSFMKR